MSSMAAAPANWRRPLMSVLAYTAAIVIAAVTLVPLLFVFIGGFRTTPQINASPTGLPHPWVLDNYRAIVTSSLFWRFIANSAVIAFLATAITVVFGAMAAFGLSRYTFRGREGIYAFFTIGLLFPLSVASLPLYLWLRDLGTAGEQVRGDLAGGGLLAVDHHRDPAPVHARDSRQSSRTPPSSTARPGWDSSGGSCIPLSLPGPLDGGYLGVRHQLELLPATAASSSTTRTTSPSRWASPPSRPSTPRTPHGCSPSGTLGVADPCLLPRRGAPDRGCSQWCRQGLTLAFVLSPSSSRPKNRARGSIGSRLRPSRAD